MIKFPMKNLSYAVFCAASFLLLAPAANSSTSRAGAAVTDYASVPPSQTRAAKAASDAVDLLQGAVTWLNDLGVAKQLSEIFKTEDNFIEKTLKSTQQAGMLYLIEIEVTRGETDFFQVAPGGVRLVGAGSSPFAVAAARRNTPFTARYGGPSQGAVIDLDRSHYIWFAHDGTQVQAVAYTMASIDRSVAFRFADEKLLETEGRKEQIRALETALKRVEQTIKDEAIKGRIAAWRDTQDKTNAARREIEAKLGVELERQRKAEKTAQLFSWISTALSLAAQKEMVNLVLGDNTPADIANASSNTELRDMVQKLADDTKQRVDTYNIQFNTTVQQTTINYSKAIAILQESKYPVDTVPELKLNFH
ncbi:hypothetical protein [Rhizobium sp. MHM7A]|uniref:hypothetical protein n=1 Tax=Rhizobium sp. MHM7A TaxID=2583233 RepID=UPI001106538B|nr:hypothetical protein [Rhizobium sp. MHM7A]TLX16683.1 hypothetical protein FFR93_04895 [Rhizobium sp. MHM7A]